MRRAVDYSVTMQYRLVPILIMQKSHAATPTWALHKSRDISIKIADDFFTATCLWSDPNPFLFAASNDKDGLSHSKLLATPLLFP